MRATTAKLAAPALAGLLLAGCTVKFSEQAELPYGCQTTADCLGDGFVCVAPEENGPKFCCQPSTEECDGADNDCNGKTDDLPERACYSGPAGTAEVGICRSGSQSCRNGAWGECFDELTPGTENCNNYDDDCDGATDETFDFHGDPEHCGNCSTVCASGQWCANGKCSKDTESCTDAIDNDRDGATDCTDSDCLNQPCQASPSVFTCDALLACSCQGAVMPQPESTCDDHGDDDCDGLLDCADPDCADKSCGVGCTCRGQKMAETLCDNARDDDGDTLIDCADPDCVDASCGSGCSCGALKKTETDCGDRVDNDADSKRDCVDEDCAGEPCLKAADGGTAAGTCASYACQ